MSLTEEQTRQFVTLYQALQGFDDRAAQSQVSCPRLCFVGSADEITYDERWGGVRVDLAGPVVSRRAELEALGWEVRVLEGLDHHPGHAGQPGSAGPAPLAHEQAGHERLSVGRRRTSRSPRRRHHRRPHPPRCHAGHGYPAGVPYTPPGYRISPSVRREAHEHHGRQRPSQHEGRDCDGYGSVDGWAGAGQVASAGRQPSAAAALAAVTRLLPASPKPPSPGGSSCPRPPRSRWWSSWPTRPIAPPPSSWARHDASTVLEGTCAPSYLEVILNPLGAYTVLGMPRMSWPATSSTSPTSSGPMAGDSGERLRATPSWDRRFGLVDRFLLGRLENGPRPAPEVVWVWRRLAATGGGVPIGRLAAEVGWSHKHLITRFRQQVGLQPKLAARLVRLDRVWRRLDQGGGLDWGLVAVRGRLCRSGPARPRGTSAASPG